MRVLDFDYEMKLLGHVTQLVDSESWSFDKVPLKTSLEELGPLEPKWVDVKSLVHATSKERYWILRVYFQSCWGFGNKKLPK